jgi:uncharacterized membrane protein
MMPSHMQPSVPLSVPPAVEATRWLAVACLVALIVQGLAWELWLAPLRPGGSWWALKVLPLCIPLAGLLRRRMYTYRWTALLVWLYFMEGAWRASGHRAIDVPFALVEVFLSLLLFVACVLHVRFRLRNAKHD